MKITVQMTIMSHLSDVQECLSRGMAKDANEKINFVKKIVLKYPDTSIEVDTSELNALWYAD